MANIIGGLNLRLGETSLPLTIYDTPFGGTILIPSLTGTQILALLHAVQEVLDTTKKEK